MYKQQHVIREDRGYGSSSRPPEMEQPPAGNPPLTRSSEVVRDIDAVVEWIRRRLGIEFVRQTKSSA